MKKIKTRAWRSEPVTLSLAGHNEYHRPRRRTYSTLTHELYIIIRGHVTPYPPTWVRP